MAEGDPSTAFAGQMELSQERRRQGSCEDAAAEAQLCEAPAPPPSGMAAAQREADWMEEPDIGWHPVQPLWQGSEEGMLADMPLLASLPPTWRLLLLSDGSVTRHLELLTGSPVAAECWEMAAVREDLRGTPPGTELVPGPRVRRQVFLRDARGSVLLYGASWWAAGEVAQALPAVQQPVWVTLKEQRTELFRSLQQMYCGHSQALERAFGVPGPMWARHYIFYRHGRPLTLIYEVFSPSLSRLIGEAP